MICNKMEHNYIIYKICNDDYPEYIYIGSTYNFIRRKWEHKKNSNNINSRGGHLKVYQIIRENGGWENWRMIPLEECGNITKTQAHIREEQLRVEHNANLNTIKAYVSEEEIKKKIKEYNENNKEHVKEKQREYNEKNKEMIKERKKEYREKNKEKFNEKDRKYREKNKEKIKEKGKEKVTCECGCEVPKNHLSRHRESKKHIKLMEAK